MRETDRGGIGGNIGLCIGRRIAALPLDAAADAGFLVGIDWVSGQQPVDCCAKIAACDRLVVAWSTVVELASVDKSSLGIKEIEFRCAGGLVGLGNFLGFVEAQGKTELELLGHLLEPLGGVIRIMSRIVAADADDAKPRVQVVLSDLGDFALDMHDIGTVSAHKDKQQGGLADKRIERIESSAHDIGQGKGRSRSAEREHHR